MSVLIAGHRTALGLSALGITAAIVLLAGPTTVASTGGDDLPPPNEAQECLKADASVVEIGGLGTFNLDLKGSIAVRTLPGFVSARGYHTVPLEILGSASRDYAEGLGEVAVWIDKSRPATGSFLRERTKGEGFPAIQHMRFHIFFETEALPGRRFRSIAPVHVVSQRVESFPPRKGTQYLLTAPVELEDVDRPGVVAVRVASGDVRITGSGPA